MPNAPFDATRAFTVRALTLLASGRNYVRGDDFDKESVAPHVLRQLYSVNQIGYTDDPLRGMVKVDPLLAPKRERKGSAKAPSVDENALAEKLMEGNTRPKLIEMAAAIEGIRPDMNKKAIALAIVRAGHAGIS